MIKKASVIHARVEKEYMYKMCTQLSELFIIIQ